MAENNDAEDEDGEDLTPEQLAALDELFEEQESLMATPTTTPDAYQEREVERQDAFRQLHGEDEVDADENQEYLEQHHAEERAASDGQGDT